MVNSIYANENITELLAFFAYTQRFPDYPKGFVPPGLSDPNYVPPTRGPSLLAGVITSMLLALIAVAARIWVRGVRSKDAWGWDDWLIVPATVFTVVFTVCAILLVQVGCVGKHSYDCPLNEIRFSYYFEYVSVIIFVIALNLIKFSIITFIYRLCPFTDRIYRIFIMITYGLVLITSLGTIFTSTFNCKPLAASWKLDIVIFGTYKCAPAYKSLSAWSIVGAATDVWIVFLPCRIIWRTRMANDVKVGVIFIFLCGLIATGAAIVKAVTVVHAYNSFDPNWAFYPVLMASQLEITFALIVACLPSLHVWLVKFIPRSFLAARLFPTTTIYSRHSRYEQTGTSQFTNSGYPKTSGTDTSQDRHYINVSELKSADFELSKPESPIYSSGTVTDTLVYGSKIGTNSEVSLDLVIQKPMASPDLSRASERYYRR